MPQKEDLKMGQKASQLTYLFDLLESNDRYSMGSQIDYKLHLYMQNCNYIFVTMHNADHVSKISAIMQRCYSAVAVVAASTFHKLNDARG